MSLRERISEEMKLAMKARDELRTSALRMLRSAILTKDKAGQGEADDAAIVQLAAGLIKQRQESAAAYRLGGREELAVKEERESVILAEFLPVQLAAEQVTALVEQAVAEVGAASLKEMGKVMALLKERVAGQADMGQVSAMVKARLGG